PSAGTAVPLYAGGPGSGGAGYYRGITTSDETVVASGSDGFINGIYSVTAGGPTLIAQTPQLMVGICAGPGGIYAASGNLAEGQVWKITPGNAALFAHGFGNTVSVAYDPLRDRIYVQDQTPPKIWVIMRNPTATRAVTIGRIHQL